MLLRLGVKCYKSFIDLDFSPHLITVVMGPNAVGKSNLLDAIGLVSRLATTTLKNAFDGHRGLPLESFFYGDKGFEANLKGEWLRSTFAVDVYLSDSVVREVNEAVSIKRQGLDSIPTREAVRERYLRYTIELEAHPASGNLRVRNEQLEALRADTKEPKQSRQPFISKSGNRLHLRMEGQARPTNYDIGLEHSIVSTPLYVPHYPHIVAFRKELERWRTFYLDPMTLMREDVPVSEVQTIGPKGENLAAFVNTLKQDGRDLRNLNRTLAAILPANNPRVDARLKPEGRVELVLTEGNIEYSARLVSEGTLRVIGLIAALHPKNPTVLVGYEEPENGVHPVRLGQIAELLKNAARVQHRQVIITTHSPSLPQYFDDKDIFVCRKEGAETKISPFDSQGPIWRESEVGRALSDRVSRGDFGG